VLCNAYPPFAVRFWSTSNNSTDDDSSRSNSHSHSHMKNSIGSTSENRQQHLDAMHHHPFVGMAMDGILQDSSLFVPIFRMLAAISHGASALVPSLSTRVVVGASTNIGTIPHSGQACALATYNLIKMKHPSRLDWNYLFHIVESYTQLLLSQQKANAGVGIGGAGRSVGSSDRGSSDSGSGPKLLPQDVDALCAIMELVGSVSHEPSVVHSFVSNGYSPISRLFGLLAAPVPSRLKGKVYTALSVVCKAGDDIAHEIWDCLEAYDVLSLMPTRDIAGNFYGIRYELEAVESAEGCYPATEGFLCLLEALLTHHKVPEAIGFGYRLPGITGYLDFVIDEVLLKVTQRSYVVVNEDGLLDVSLSDGSGGGGRGGDSTAAAAARGTGQRWAMASHCIKILGAVIQQYPINEFTSGGAREVLSHFSRMKSSSDEDVKTWTQEEVAEYAADFTEVTRQYNIEQTAPPPPPGSGSSGLEGGGGGGGSTQQEILRWPRPKSSGFVVMARILDSYGVVLNCLMGILRENSSHALDSVYANQLEARSLDALRALFIASADAAEGQSDQASAHRTHGKHHWGSGSSWGSGGAMFTPGGTSSATSHVFDYGLLSMSPTCTDALFWREKCVNAAIGLLYECSLREKVFMQCVSAAPPLTIIRTTAGRPSVHELHLCDMFVSLASYQTKSPYALLAYFIRYSPVASRMVIVMPSVPVMAVRILELASPQGSAAEARLLRSNDVFEEPASFSLSGAGWEGGGGAERGVVQGVGFIRACALALRDPSDVLAGHAGSDPIALSIATHGVAPPSDVVPVGTTTGGCKHDLYTLTLSDDSSYSSSANVDVTYLARPSEESHEAAARHSIFEHSDETAALMGYSSAQGAVLDFLLRGLTQARYGIVHRLLGFVVSSGRDSGSGDNSETRAGRLVLRAGVNSTCAFVEAGASASDAINSTDSCLFAALDVLDHMTLRLRQSMDETEGFIPDQDAERGYNGNNNNGGGGGGAILTMCSLQAYDIANKCMELLYQLCANPLTSGVVLELLRQRLVRHVGAGGGDYGSPRGGNGGSSQRMHSFYISQLQLCLFWANAPCIDTSGGGSGSDSDRTSGNGSAAQMLIHTCRMNYTAWFLKLLALELHTAEIRSDSSVSSRQILKLLSSLFGSGGGGGHGHLYDTGYGSVFENASSELPITQLIALLSPPAALPPAVTSQDAVAAFAASSRPYYIGVVAGNEALLSQSRTGDRDATAGGVGGSVFSLISLRDVRNAIQGVGDLGTGPSSQDGSSTASDAQRRERVAEAVDTAAAYNRYTVQMASSAHLCNAWRQVVDVSLLGWGKLLMPLADTDNLGSLGGEVSGGRLSISVLIDELMLPVIDMLANRNDLEMVSAEPLTRSLLSMAAFLREICAVQIRAVLDQHSDRDARTQQQQRWSSGGGAGGHAPALAMDYGGALLSESQHESLVTGIVRAIFCRGSSGVVRINGSIMYRSFLYSALVHILRMMNVGPAYGTDCELAVAGEGEGGGDVIAYETAATEYRIRSMVSSTAFIPWFIFYIIISLFACCFSLY
jgi:hypothetical protein